MTTNDASRAPEAVSEEVTQRYIEAHERIVGEHKDAFRALAANAEREKIADLLEIDADVLLRGPQGNTTAIAIIVTDIRKAAAALRAPAPSPEWLERFEELKGDYRDAIEDGQLDAINATSAELDAHVRTAAAPRNGCTRSHPHENMDQVCELRTEVARLTNELVTFRTAAAPSTASEREPDAWGLLLEEDDGTASLDSAAVHRVELEEGVREFTGSQYKPSIVPLFRGGGAAPGGERTP